MNVNISLSGWKVSELTPSRVDTPNGSISVSWSSNSDGGERDRQAEEAARLVAAVPDLLSALQSAVRNFEFEGHAYREWHDYARKAIAKATGEET